VAANDVPPHSNSLFSIHSVQDDIDGDGGDLWLHTHGLLRCGSIEFEMIGAPAASWTRATELLRAIAVMAIEHGVGPPKTRFSPGIGLSLEWLPWPEAASVFSRRLGARKEDRDDVHRLPSGVLVERRWVWPLTHYAPPRRALEAMENDPALYLSKMETDRMERLAAVRFPLFRRAFDLHGGTHGWEFFIKFGYAVDDEREEASREHLWLRCRQVNETRAFGELLNSPCLVSNMEQGQRGWHELALMTDWRVVTPEGPYDPDSIAALLDGDDASSPDE
jgi:hypothetical protein